MERLTSTEFLYAFDLLELNGDDLFAVSCLRGAKQNWKGCSPGGPGCASRSISRATARSSSSTPARWALRASSRNAAIYRTAAVGGEGGSTSRTRRALQSLTVCGLESDDHISAALFVLVADCCLRSASLAHAIHAEAISINTVLSFSDARCAKRRHSAAYSRKCAASFSMTHSMRLLHAVAPILSANRELQGPFRFKSVSLMEPNPLSRVWAALGA